MATLIMGRSASHCSHCGKSADPGEMGHYTKLGYIGNGDPGCGEPWDEVNLDFFLGKERMKAQVDFIKSYMYPNLKDIPFTFYDW